jgi:hypothetical protein
MSSLRTIALGAILLAATLSCGSHFAKSYSMKFVTAKPPSLLVAEKIERPLYLVLDPAKVPDSFDLVTSAGDQFKLTEFQKFVSRDLRQALMAYFSNVEVVNSPSLLPSTPHIVGDIKVDRVQLHALPVGGLTYVKIEMNWALAFRPNEATEYAFSFAGTGTSSESYPTFEAGCGQMVEDSIAGMIKKWTEAGGIQKLKSPKGGAS